MLKLRLETKAVVSNLLITQQEWDVPEHENKHPVNGQSEGRPGQRLVCARIIARKLCRRNISARINFIGSLWQRRLTFHQNKPGRMKEMVVEPVDPTNDKTREHVGG